MYGRAVRRDEIRSPQGDGSRIPRTPQIDLRSELSGLLSRHGIRPDKRFGQHFLASTKVVEAILSRVEGYAGILEIGPGVGVLTKPLSERSESTVAVELDERVLPVLADYAPAARIVHQDVLKTDLAMLLEGLPSPRAVVSNMPYNITGPLLTAIAAQRSLFGVAVLMMQREVGDRILAEPGDRHRGSLSVFLQSQFVIEKVCLVPGGAFMPPPKVESIVLQFTPNDRQFSDKFFALVRAGFVQPRKTLWNNVAATGLVRPTFDAFLESQSLPEGVRPHQLTLAHWEVLAGLATNR